MWNNLICIQSQVIAIRGDIKNAEFYFPILNNFSSPFGKECIPMFMRMSHVACHWPPRIKRRMFVIDFSSPNIQSHLSLHSGGKYHNKIDSLMLCSFDEPQIAAIQNTYELMDNPSPTPQQSCRFLGFRNSGLEKGRINIECINTNSAMAKKILDKCIFYVFLEFFVFAEHSQLSL